MFKDVFENLQFGDAILVTAPPGWGKTYKILKSLKESQKTFCFIFPLRALCEEVFRSALEFRIKTINYRKSEEYSDMEIENAQLFIMTPEQLNTDILDLENTIFILDEFHLFYYWGQTFRERLLDCLHELSSTQVPLIMLSATISEELFTLIKPDLDFNYHNIYKLDFGNQSLKNIPTQIYFYPRLNNWLLDDLFYSPSNGTKLVFCAFRNQVKELAQDLSQRGFNVLSCVGGEAREFTDKLSTAQKLDFIVATSVISHGVNLPNISEIYFTYKVENLDFYIQMLGRGGRAGEGFSVHTLNSNYFNKKQIFKGFINSFKKRLSNKVESLIYCFYEN